MATEKLVDDYCHGCGYLVTGMDADEHKIMFCDFCGITKTRRGCPAGKGCTRYAPKLSIEEIRQRIARTWFVGKRYGGETKKPPET